MWGKCGFGSQLPRYFVGVVLIYSLKLVVPMQEINTAILKWLQQSVL
jgi:hypothetical protein